MWDRIFSVKHTTCDGTGGPVNMNHVGPCLNQVYGTDICPVLWHKRMANTTDVQIFGAGLSK